MYQVRLTVNEKTFEFALEGKTDAIGQGFVDFLKTLPGVTDLRTRPVKMPGPVAWESWDSVIVPPGSAVPDSK